MNPTITLIGLGAMGSFFAPRLALAYPDTFRILASGERRERLMTKGVTINDVNYHFPVIQPNDDVAPADVIIMAVKGYSLTQAIEDIRSQVGPNTIILPVMNGVDSEETLIQAFGEEHVLYSFMRISIVMKDGITNFNPNGGAVHFGERHGNVENAYSDRVNLVKQIFDKAQIPYVIDPDMERALWFKYMCNIGENMTCGLLGIPFGAYRVSDYANNIRKNAMREVIAIAQAKGIALSEADIEAQEPIIQNIPYPNKPSTLQDIEGGKHTEIDMFSGNLIRMGKELGIPTPINEVFYNGIKVLEQKNDGVI